MAAAGQDQQIMLKFLSVKSQRTHVLGHEVLSCSLERISKGLVARSSGRESSYNILETHHFVLQRRKKLKRVKFF